MASLEDRLSQFSSPVQMLRNAQIGPYVFPVAAEFSNWRDEQRSWRESVALIDQSYHMTDLYVSGPDVMKLVSSLAVNSFANFGRDKAKQFVACNYDGYLIGDMVIFGLEDDLVAIVGRPAVANWVQFHAETGGFDVAVERDERSVSNPGPRKIFRYELQGPRAWALLEKLNGGPLPEFKFFQMGEVTIAGQTLRALRHGMAGAPGLEFWGPVALAARIKAAILEAGREFGLEQVGGRAYSTIAIESGWIPSPLPAVYTGEQMRPYRQWLGADSFEAVSSLGGSMASDDIQDYYLTPWDLDYGRLIKFDHEFIGRAALERMASRPHRRKVTLEWNKDDVLSVYASQLQEGDNGKFMEMPAAHYATHPYDRVEFGGRAAGISTYPVYLHPDRAWISLATLDADAASLDGEVTIIWGEENGGTAKPVVERHFQKKVRARVAPWPWSKTAREQYRPRPPAP